MGFFLFSATFFVSLITLTRSHDHCSCDSTVLLCTFDASLTDDGELIIPNPGAEATCVDRNGWHDKGPDYTNNKDVMSCPLSSRSLALLQRYTRRSITGKECYLRDLPSRNLFAAGLKSLVVHCTSLRPTRLTTQNTNNFTSVETCSLCNCSLETAALWSVGSLLYYTATCLDIHANSNLSSQNILATVTMRRTPFSCSSSPCQNGGVCTSDDPSCHRPDGVCCKCLSLFAGDFCEEIAASGCALSPCFPGISCTDGANGTFECGSCPEGLYGDGSYCATNKTTDTVVVRAVDAQTLQIIGQVTVSVLLRDSATNESSAIVINETVSGNSTLMSQVPRGKTLIVVVSSQGYASNSLVTQPVPDIENLVTLYLKKRAAPVSLPYSSSNFTISFQAEGESASENISLPLYTLTFPPDALEDVNGTAVSITFTGVDPTESLTGVPDLLAVQGNETQVQVNLNSLALAEILLQDATTGKAISLKKPVEVQLPLSPKIQASLGDVIEAWYFNETLGIWVQEGAGIVKEINGSLVWVYNASHFSWWNCDRPWTDKNCIEVAVHKYSDSEDEDTLSEGDDNGDVPVVESPSIASTVGVGGGVDVSLSGIDFIYTAKKKTNPSSTVCFDFKRNSKIKISVIDEEKGYFTKDTEVLGNKDPATCDRRPQTICIQHVVVCNCDCFRVPNTDIVKVQLAISIETPANTLIENLYQTIRTRITTDCLRARLLQGVMTFSSSGPNGIKKDLFSLEEKTGKLHLVKTLDPDKEKTTFDFTVLLQLSGPELLSLCGCEETITSFRMDVSLQITEKLALNWIFFDSGFVREGRNGANRTYTNPAEEGSPWSVQGGGQDLTFTFEDSAECGTDVQNSNTQVARASATVVVPEKTTLLIFWYGEGEAVSMGYEKMDIFVDGIAVIQAHSPGGGLGHCTMDSVVSNVVAPFKTILDTGNHKILVYITSLDGLYHFKAFYKIKVLLN